MSAPLPLANEKEEEPVAVEVGPVNQHGQPMAVYPDHPRSLKNYFPLNLTFMHIYTLRLKSVLTMSWLSKIV